MKNDELTITVKSDGFAVIISVEESQIDSLVNRIAKRVSYLVIDKKPDILEVLPASPGTILRLSEIVKRIGLSRSSVYKMMGEGTFPASIKLGERSVGWRYEDIKRWQDSRV